MVHMTEGHVLNSDFETLKQGFYLHTDYNYLYYDNSLNKAS